MKVMRRSRWSARPAATLVVGVAALVAVASAPGFSLAIHTVPYLVGL